jgi:integrase
VLERALRGGQHLTRPELATALRRAGISAEGPRLGHLMMHAELDQVTCSGPRRAKQFTYALLEERAPRARTLRRDEALAELARRYFSSHGPATLRDYVWWSGLTARDAKRGLEMVKPALVREVIDKRNYWFVASRSRAPRASPSAYLLPNYDEYLIAYKDRGPVVTASPKAKGIDRSSEGFAHHLVIDGRLAGSWRRTLKRDSVVVEAAPYGDLSRADERALAAAVERYKERAPEISFLTLKEIDEQLNALAGDTKLQTAVATLIFAGLRREELLWLTSDDIDWNAGTYGLIRIRAKTLGDESWQPKTKKNRAVPVSSRLRPHLEKLRLKGHRGPWLFPNGDGTRYDPDNFSSDLRGVIRATVRSMANASASTTKASRDLK